MIKLCAWCGDYLGEIEPRDDYRITHGICGPCRDRWLAEAGLIDVIEIGGNVVGLADDDALEAEAKAEIERLGFDPAEVRL